MTNDTYNRKGLIILSRLKSGGTLPRRRTIPFLLFSLLIITVFPVVSCRKSLSPGKDPDKSKDSTTVHIRFAEPIPTYGALDLLIYDSVGECPLEQHLRFEGKSGKELQIRTLKGDKEIVAIAGSPKKLNSAALSKLSYIRKILFSYEEDNPLSPILTARGKSSGGECELDLRALLCRIKIESISNTLDDYVLLEEPKLRLLNVNATICPFSSDGEHFPSETLDSPAVPLAYDIGYYPQNLDITLYSYPNSSSEDVLGPERTYLELSCIIEGCRHTMHKEIPPLEREQTLGVEIIVESQNSMQCNFRRINEQ